MFVLEDTDEIRIKFDTVVDLQDYIEQRHAEEGGWDWISEINDDNGTHYGCSWKVEINEI